MKVSPGLEQENLVSLFTEQNLNSSSLKNYEALHWSEEGVPLLKIVAIIQSSQSFGLLLHPRNPPIPSSTFFNL